jgi:hypothetical protein
MRRSMRICFGIALAVGLSPMMTNGYDAVAQPLRKVTVAVPVAAIPVSTAM